MDGAVLRIASARAVLVVAACFFQSACLVLPVRIAPGTRGVVVDAETGAAVADAVVVVRFDGRHGDVLPDREVLGYREVRSDADGRFEMGSLVRPGLSAWPVYRTDARIVAVLKEGYRCPPPLGIRRDAPVQVRLQPALDLQDQRDSCRPVPASPDEAEEYMAAWRGLFPPAEPSEDAESERQIARILKARAALGFGDNCEGPVFDLALSPDGSLASYIAGSEVPEVRIVEFTQGGSRRLDFVFHEAGWPPRRLAWTSAGDLVLWEPSADADRSVSPSLFGSDRFEVVWRARQQRVAPPAAPGFREGPVAVSNSQQYAPLEPADLNDEGDARWLGRSFLVKPTIDTETGLGQERIEIVRADGSRNAISLPGEACGPNGRFGRPHYRITQDGSSGVDLRYVDGGCHAVQIDFESGAWTRIDASAEMAACHEARVVPASHFTAALRGYAAEVQAARTAAGGDPAASYALIIAPDGSTHVETRNHVGTAVSAELPDFPITTPLRRIDVSLVGTVYQAPTAPTPVPAPRDLDPL